MVLAELKSLNMERKKEEKRKTLGIYALGAIATAISCDWQERFVGM